jgi:hypothetical protein
MLASFSSLVGESGAGPGSFLGTRHAPLALRSGGETQQLYTAPPDGASVPSKKGIV